MKQKTARQELAEFVESGKLRDAVSSGRLSSEASDLLIRVVTRYTDPRPARHKDRR